MGYSRAVRSDVEFGMRIAKEVSRLDIGQSVVVKKGTVLVVPARRPAKGTREAAPGEVWDTHNRSRFS
jgi:DUF1009 family protein